MEELVQREISCIFDTSAKTFGRVINRTDCAFLYNNIDVAIATLMSGLVLRI